MAKFYLKELQEALDHFVKSVPQNTQPTVTQMNFAVGVPDPNPPRFSISARPVVMRTAIASWDGKEWVIEL
jgi:hypothetical protein